MSDKPLRALYIGEVQITIAFEPRDLWVGVYWNREDMGDDARIYLHEIYVCIIPMLPIRLAWLFGHPSDEVVA